MVSKLRKSSPAKKKFMPKRPHRENKYCVYVMKDKYGKCRNCRRVVAKGSKYCPSHKKK